ncbi:hypothetical protein KO507_10595 [Gilvimarinus agarilyticus]|uniref:Ig-like domain-containing protein n=1 Tax=Gilvimarinus sp. 2_MG-2023 TaxID=3062666 RepID=UPI001C0A0713|nr:Ig-like domain-containing protein [Gilvimarinus sp. 2_MG-2023]MBU2886211.1 hypothetical protein [Gilvimarinus agarilyticus]MDO6570899.1 Ig-like domain-containing protein [Gilvimarinus sp. 2_MG-2023]
MKSTSIALTLICALVFCLFNPAQAFQSNIGSAEQLGPSANVCFEARWGASGNTRIQHQANNSQLVAGEFWLANTDTIMPGSTVTVASIESCGYTAPVIISQVGPTGATYAADDYIGIIWRASELGGADVYQYEFAITGAVTTSALNTRTLMGTRPTVGVTSSSAAVAAGDTATITFTIDQPVTLANAAAISVSGGTLSSVTGSGTSYSATFTPTNNSNATAQISVGNGAFEVSPGQTNQDAADANNTVSIAVDTLSPTIAIAPFTGPANGNQTALITLSENSTDFTLADLSLTNASATLTGSDASYTAVLTPLSDGLVTLSVAANTFNDAAGNDNTASNQVSMTYDGTPPSISIGAFTGPANGNQTALITLSENSTDFTLADLSLTNATATLSGSGSSYTAVLTPLSDGLVTLSVAANTFNDAAGNDNTTSNQVSMTYDGTPPSISIGAFTGPINGDQTAVITLSELSTDFEVSDLTVTNAAVNLTGAGASYTAVLTPLANGTVTLLVGAGTFSDTVGNVNDAASNTVSREVYPLSLGSTHSLPAGSGLTYLLLSALFLISGLTYLYSTQRAR